MKDYLELIDIIKKGVRKKLGKLNAAKSAGPDGHHWNVYKINYYNLLRLSSLNL